MPQNKDRQIGLSPCPCGQGSFLRLHWKPRPDGSYSVLRTVYAADAAAADFYKQRLQRYLSAQKHAKKAKSGERTAAGGDKPPKNEG